MQELTHIDSAVFAACELPASWLRAANNRGADSRSLLQGTGLFQDDWLDPAKYITPRQLQQLFRNVCEAKIGTDTAFILGARAAQQGCLDALPLWSTSTWSHGAKTWIAWEGAHSDLSGHVSHAIAFATYMHETLRSQVGEDAVWTYHFKHRRAEDFPDAWAFLGPKIHFAQPANLICMEHSRTEVVTQAAPRTFLEDIRHRLTAWPDLTLPACARQLDMSPATLKRRLATHGTTYQRQIDLLRSSRAVEIATRRDYSVESAVHALGCGTPSNLRRDTRRLLGVTPDALYAAFA